MKLGQHTFMALGLSDLLWDISDVVKLFEDAEAAPRVQGPYAKRI